MTNKEIEDLKKALEASPDNDFIRHMLMDKMAHFADYHPELEELIQHGLRQRPYDFGLKGRLINLYFQQEKFGTCIVIAEENDSLQNYSAEVQATIAKCYLKEENIGKAQEVYKNLISDHPSYMDKELDEALRQKSHTEEGSGLIDEGLFSRPDISFADVGGMEDIKREIDLKIIKPLENADLYAQYGKKVGGGILLYGPPGCGKTFIAKATAGEINANFISVSLDDILDMWIGQSEKNLASYFELARSKKPCVLFFDEVDALGAKRSDLKQSSGRNVINQFLAELDGISSDNEGLLVIGATNAPWHLDSAFRRPGRFDRIIFVPPPDDESKEEILRLKLSEKPQKNIDLKKVIKKAKDYSGADINAIIDIAIESVLEKAMETGIPEPIQTQDLLDAIKKHPASTKEWFTTAKNYALFANQSGLYDSILKYIK